MDHLLTVGFTTPTDASETNELIHSMRTDEQTSPLIAKMVQTGTEGYMLGGWYSGSYPDKGPDSTVCSIEHQHMDQQLCKFGSMRAAAAQDNLTMMIWN